MGWLKKQFKKWKKFVSKVFDPAEVLHGKKNYKKIVKASKAIHSAWFQPIKVSKGPKGWPTFSANKGLTNALPKSWRDDVNAAVNAGVYGAFVQGAPALAGAGVGALGFGGGSTLSFLGGIGGGDFFDDLDDFLGGIGGAINKGKDIIDNFQGGGGGDDYMPPSSNPAPPAFAGSSDGMPTWAWVLIGVAGVGLVVALARK